VLAPLRIAGSLLAALALSASPAAAARRASCSGTSAHPGVLAGPHTGEVDIRGVCSVNGGPTLVKGLLVLEPRSVLLAAYALDDRSRRGSSTLTVRGAIRVLKGATLLLGCEFGHFTCLDDPTPKNATLAGSARVFGSILATAPLAVVVHNATVTGSVTELGGGGGASCKQEGLFATLPYPTATYSDYEDMSIGGNLSVSGMSSCWLGMARDHVRGNVRVVGNTLADPDAIEILSNVISGGLYCLGNSSVWDSTEGQSEAAPRTALPNQVRGPRGGDCRLAPPAGTGAQPGPGAF
jgi:hypothetical protein